MNHRAALKHEQIEWTDKLFERGMFHGREIYFRRALHNGEAVYRPTGKRASYVDQRNLGLDKAITQRDDDAIHWEQALLRMGMRKGRHAARLHTLISRQNTKRFRVAAQTQIEAEVRREVKREAKNARLREHSR